jgi:hypothetical protein
MKSLLAAACLAVLAVTPNAEALNATQVGTFTGTWYANKCARGYSSEGGTFIVIVSADRTTLNELRDADGNVIASWAGTVTKRGNFRGVIPTGARVQGRVLPSGRLSASWVLPNVCRGRVVGERQVSGTTGQTGVIVRRMPDLEPPPRVIVVVSPVEPPRESAGGTGN